MKNRKKHFTTKHTHLKSGNKNKKVVNWNIREESGFYNPSSNIQSMSMKRKVGITIEINRKDDKQIQLKSFVVEYNDMLLLNKEIKQNGNPLDFIDELIRSKDISENKKDEILPKLVMGYLPKTKCFELIERINKNGEWDEFGIILSFIVLDKGIYVDKSIPMKFSDWEKKIRNTHKGKWNEFNKINKQQLN